MSTLSLIYIFIGEILVIFMLSRISLQKSYRVLHKLLKNDRSIVFVVSLVYFPGTLLHELSHYVVALVLNLHPSEMQLFPVIEGNKVKLGHVLYEKPPHDFIRSVLVGIAPFIGGLLSLWLIIQIKLFPGTEWWQTLFFGYLILTITANMFSSPQDLVDVGYLIPVGVLIALIFYLFPLHLDPHFLEQLSGHVNYFIKTIQIPLLFSLGTHAILILLLSIGK